MSKRTNKNMDRRAVRNALKKSDISGHIKTAGHFAQAHYGGGVKSRDFVGPADHNIEEIDRESARQSALGWDLRPEDDQ